MLIFVTLKVFYFEKATDVADIIRLFLCLISKDIWRFRPVRAL